MYPVLQELRSEYGAYAKNIFIGGLMGCRGDAYKAGQALNPEEAKVFHLQQATLLKDAGVDFICGTTLPAMSEALGLAQALALTGKPYILSFVIRPNGTLLDGNSLNYTISQIDRFTSPQPIFYMVNCVHSSVLVNSLLNHANNINLVRKRLIGIQANTSSKSPEELDGMKELQTEDIGTLVNETVRLYLDYGIKVLGGCCGTNEQYLIQLTTALKNILG